MWERCSDEIWQVFYLLEEKSGKLMPKLVVGSTHPAALMTISKTQTYSGPIERDKT